jgi:PIN domain nuclease of toxin-antitoxin system
VRLLLDTHAFLWYVWGSSSMSATARGLVEDEANESLVSAASLWEIAIKVSTGKLALNGPFNLLKSDHVDANGFRLLPIEFEHSVIVSELPFHHKDPFDRLLVARSLAENIPLVSADAQLDDYGIQRLW